MSDDKLIDQFLRDELDAEGLKAFNAKRNQNSSFDQEVRFQQEAKQFLRHREKHNQLKNQLQQLREADNSGRAKVVPLRRRIFVITSLAAAIALLVFFAYPFLFPTSLYDQFAEHQELAFQTRNTNNELKLAVEQSFNQGDYEAAYRHLSKLSQDTQQKDAYTQLALGIAALETDQTIEAEQVFEELIEGTSAFKGDALWYLSLTYVKQGQKELAASTLQRISDGSFWKSKADELLKRL